MVGDYGDRLNKFNKASHGCGNYYLIVGSQMGKTNYL